MRGRYPIVADCCRNEDGLNFAIRCLAPGGVCTSVGYYFKKKNITPCNADVRQWFDISYRSVTSSCNTSRCNSLNCSRKFHPGKITTFTANWEDAAEAFLERTTKVVLHRRSVFEQLVCWLPGSIYMSFTLYRSERSIRIPDSLHIR